MSKVWVVMRRDYEYNDETYNANDGDECVFSVNDVYFTTTPHDGDEDEEGYEELNRWGEDSGAIQDRVWDDIARKYIPNPKLSPELVSAMNKLSNIVHSSEDILLAMFDNHVWVRAHADGFDVQEFEHD